MTPSDALLWALCYLAASLLIAAMNPLFEYIVAVSIVLAWLVIMGLMPICMVGLACAFAGAVADHQCHDSKSTRWSLIAVGAGMSGLTFLVGAFRLAWPLVSLVYLWQPDIDLIAQSVTAVSRF